MSQNFHDLTRNLLGPLYAPIRELFWSAFALTERTALCWVACYVLVAFAVYLRSERVAGTPLFAGFRRYLLPEEIYAHPSARADLIYFAVDKLVLFATLSLLPLSGDLITRALLRLSAREMPAPPRLWASAVLTLAVFIAFDLGAFVWHYLTHRVPALWAFHRVHHCVEVLTPLSNYREHPVDSIGRSLVQGTLVGIAQAGMLRLLPAARPLEVFGINAVYLPFFALANARHSHVWLSFGRRVSHVLSSPAQHQCHHGTAKEHVDVNYGLVLSLWDWACGTLYVPRQKEDVRYGLIGEQRPFPTVASMYLQPFRDAWLRLPGRAAPPKQPGPLDLGPARG